MREGKKFFRVYKGPMLGEKFQFPKKGLPKIFRFWQYSPGPFIHFYKKVSFDFAIALCSIGAPDIPKKICSAIRDGEHGFLSHAHFYRGKINRFCLKWC